MHHWPETVQNQVKERPESPKPAQTWEQASTQLHMECSILNAAVCLPVPMPCVHTPHIHINIPYRFTHHTCSHTFHINTHYTLHSTFHILYTLHVTYPHTVYSHIHPHMLIHLMFTPHIYTHPTYISHTCSYHIYTLYMYTHTCPCPRYTPHIYNYTCSRHIYTPHVYPTCIYCTPAHIYVLPYAQATCTHVCVHIHIVHTHSTFIYTMCTPTCTFNIQSHVYTHTCRWIPSEHTSHLNTPMCTHPQAHTFTCAHMPASITTNTYHYVYMWTHMTGQGVPLPGSAPAPAPGPSLRVRTQEWWCQGQPSV